MWPDRKGLIYVTSFFRVKIFNFNKQQKQSSCYIEQLSASLVTLRQLRRNLKKVTSGRYCHRFLTPRWSPIFDPFLLCSLGAANAGNSIFFPPKINRNSEKFWLLFFAQTKYRQVSRLVKMAETFCKDCCKKHLSLFFLLKVLWK